MQSPRKIVPLKDERLALSAHVPNLTYHIGKLLTSVEVFTIFWGNAWELAPQSGLIDPLNAFFDFILTSSLMDVLSQYSVQEKAQFGAPAWPAQIIGYGRRVGTQTITDTEPGWVQADGSRLVTDTGVQDALQGWINHGAIPQPGRNTLFFIYLPPHVTSGLDKDRSCVTICGYHNYVDNIIYAVIPFPDCAGCGSGTDQPLDSLTEVSSHELCEAITDPDDGGWWDDDLGEIGDVCNFKAMRLGGFNVQAEWSPRDLDCVVSTPVLNRTGQYQSPPATGAPTALLVPGQRTDDIVYRAASGHLRELWRDAQECTGAGDLTGNAPAGTPAAAGNPFGYVDTSQNTSIVLFRTSNGGVHSLHWSTGTPGHDELSLVAGAPRATGDPIGYYVPAADMHHVIYRIAGGHLQELFWAGEQPVQGGGDLIAVATPPAPPVKGQPSAFAGTNDRNMVVYRGGANHIRMLHWATGAVTHEDLSGAAGTPDAAADPVAYYTAYNDTHQVVYEGTDGHLWEIWWSGNERVVGWDLSAPSGAPRPSGAPAAYYSAGTNTKHVIYRSGDGRLHEIWWVPGGGTPAHVDITERYKVPGAADRPVAFTIEGPNTQHVAYRGTDNQLYEVIW